MVDRSAREKMVSTIRSYMDGSLDAFGLADAVDDIRYATPDCTVEHIAHALWFHYDELKNHQIVASKQEWDHFNRLLLLLQSDGELDFTNSWRLGARQVIAGACLLAFAAVALQTGVGSHLLVYVVPFGVISMLLAWHGRREWRLHHKAELVTTPFPTISSLLTVRRRVPTFRKLRYPPSLANRRIRAPFVEAVTLIPFHAAWLLFAPVALLFQLLPDREKQATITLAETAVA
jgi:hypothetical protein